MDVVVVYFVKYYMKKGKVDFIVVDKRKELIVKVSCWEIFLIGKIVFVFCFYYLDVEGILFYKNEEDFN